MSTKKELGSVMYVPVWRDDSGAIYVGQEGSQQCLTADDESIEEFCQQLLALANVKSPEEVLRDGLRELVDEGRRVVPRTRLDALLVAYEKAVSQS